MNTSSEQVLSLPPPFSGMSWCRESLECHFFGGCTTFYSGEGFLNPSLTVKGSPLPSPKLPVASSSIMVVKDDWVKGAPPPLCGCTSDTITAEKGDFRSTGLVQSQKWPVGFGPSGEIVLWDQGGEIWDEEDGVSPFPLDACFQTHHWIG